MFWVYSFAGDVMQSDVIKVTVSLPPIAESHAQPLRLLFFLPLHVLEFLFFHLSVDLQLFIGQPHRGHSVSNGNMTITYDCSIRRAEV